MTVVSDSIPRPDSPVAPALALVQAHGYPVTTADQLERPKAREMTQEEQEAHDRLCETDS